MLHTVVHRALPALLALWGVTLLGVALLDWAGYGCFLHVLALTR
jgi:hypothetical protein